MSTNPEVKPEDLDYLPLEKRKIAAKRLNSGTRAARQGTSNQGNWEIPKPRLDIAEHASKAFLLTSNH